VHQVDKVLAEYALDVQRLLPYFDSRQRHLQESIPARIELQSERLTAHAWVSGVLAVRQNDDSKVMIVIKKGD
jgi:hypothetical protein